MRDDNFYCVYGWMVNRLHLKGSGLALFAVVYGLIRRDEKRGGSGEIELSTAYASEATGLKERQTINELNNLVDNEIIERTERKGKKSLFKLSYSTKVAISKRGATITPPTPATITPLSAETDGKTEKGCKDYTPTPATIAPHPCNNCTPRGCKDYTPNNRHSRDYSRDYSNGEGNVTETEPRGEPRALSLAELTRQYSRKLSEVDSIEDEGERSKRKIVLEYWYQKEKRRLGG